MQSYTCTRFARKAQALEKNTAAHTPNGVRPAGAIFFPRLSESRRNDGRFK